MLERCVRIGFQELWCSRCNLHTFAAKNQMCGGQMYSHVLQEPYSHLCSPAFLFSVTSILTRVFPKNVKFEVLDFPMNLGLAADGVA